MRLVDAFYATYAATRNKYMTQDAPVPSSFRAHVIERYNHDIGADDSLRLSMVGPPDRQIVTPPGDPETVDAIRRFSESRKPMAETAYFTSGKEVLLRTIYPSVASEQSCVDCHNQLRPDRPQWKLNDVMGAFVLSVRADTFLKQAAQEAVILGLLIFIATTGIGFFSLSLQRNMTGRVATERELRAAKVEAEAANLAKTRFLATMSHEIRTPLNAILGYSEIIMGEVAGPLGNGKYRDYARGINGSGEHLLSIVNDILDLTKIEAGHMTLHDDVIDLPEIIKSCFKFVQPRADDAGVTLTMAVAKDLPALMADELRLKQIILNLVSNAVKFTRRGGRVTVKAGLDSDNGMVLTVSDNGVGMTAEGIAVALQPFHQADNVLPRNRDGTGLGLPLTKDLVELHGGTISIDSELGRGTDVRVTFPSGRVRAQQRA